MPAAKAVGDAANLVEADARVETGGVDSLRCEKVDLVLHERDERRDDDGDAVEHQRGELVAEALARTGREHGEGGAAGEQGLDDLLLAGPEGVEAESLGENLVDGRCARGRVGHCGHPTHAPVTPFRRMTSAGVGEDRER